MKSLYPLLRCEFMACGKHETASRLLRFAFYANGHRSLGRVVMEPILTNTSDLRTLRGTGLHAIGRILGKAAVDDFFWQRCNFFSVPGVG